MSAVVQAASQGLGVAIVSWPLSESWFRSGSLVRAFDEEVVTDEQFFLAHRPEENDREEVGRLIEWMIEKFRRDR